jgi:electron transport complex protein RnfE
MADNSYRNLTSDGLWHNNQALVALLGLCPLLAVTNTAINGLGLGLATIAVLVSSNATVSLIRTWYGRRSGCRSSSWSSPPSSPPLNWA